MGVTETCSICGSSFDMQFRYQMEERDGAFLFFCSQTCLQESQATGGAAYVTCDACSKRFQVELVTHVLYVKGLRKYACSVSCRSQLAREAEGARLGEFTVPTPAPAEVAPAPTPSVGISTPAGSTLRASAASPSIQQIAGARTISRGAAATAQMSASQARPQRAISVPIPTSLHPSSVGTTIAEAAVTVPGQGNQSPVTHPGDRHERSTRPAQTTAPAEPRRPSPRGASVPHVIAVFNHKGGTGKTTTSVSLAAGLALRGRRVLLVDTDAQGNVAVSLDVKSQRSLYHVLVMGLSVSEAIITVRDHLDLIPSNESLAAAELYLAGRTQRDRVLAKRLERAADSYDHVILDCSPSLSLMNQNALVFADSVLVPVACDYLSLVGVRQVIRTVKNVNQLLHHPVQIWGVLPTLYDARARICRDALDTLRNHFGNRCLAPIRAAMKVKEAPAKAQTIFEYAPGSGPTEDYAGLVDAVLGIQRSPQHMDMDAAVSA